MKKTLILKSEDPSDDIDLERAIRLQNLLNTIHDFQAFLRSELKHGNHPTEVYEYLDKVRTKFYDCFQENEADIFLQ